MATTSYGSYLNNYYQKPATKSYNQKQAATPAIQKAPTQFNYSGPRNYSQYTSQNSDSMYGNFLKKQYDDPTKLATNAKGETAYDMQRQRVQGDTEAVKQRESEALKRKLAASGMDNSGMAFKQQRILNKDIGEYAGRQMSDISTEELGAQERQAERLGKQAFDAEEAGKERAESQRQFDSSSDIKAAIFQTETAMDAWKTGDKMAYDRWVEENNINKEDADREWEAEMKERDRESRMAEMLAGKDFEDIIATRSENRKTKTAYYHNAGLAGSLDEAQLSQLQKDDPDAYMAYIAGKEGKSVEDAQSESDFQKSIRDALIPLMADPNRNKFAIQSLVDLAKVNGFEIKMPETTQTQQTPEDIAANDPANVQAYYKGAASPSSPNNYAYQEKLKSAPVVNATIDNKTLNLLGNIPQAGSLVNVNGRLMQVTKTSRRNVRNAGDVIRRKDNVNNVTNADGTSTQETVDGRNADYFELLDLSTGKIQSFTGSSGDITAGKSVNSINDWANSLTIEE